MRHQQVKQRRVRLRDAAHRAQRRVHLFRFHQEGVDAGEPHGQRIRRGSGWPPVRD
jgi:hypothetical protein